MIPVKVHSVVFSQEARGFAVILNDEVGNKWLPIYVGPFEAQSIALELEKIVPPRPLTHDLLKNITRTLNGAVIKVEVVDLKENTFYAVITLDRNGEKIEIDSRPSDAIALALRFNAPIFVAQNVLEQAGMESKPESVENNQLAELQKKLREAIETENFEEAARLKNEITRLSKK